MKDINGGHWELWKEDIFDEDKNIIISVDTPLIGRNPAADVRWDGLVGIDFGTKSTVVSYQDGTDKTYLHRIGIGKISKKAEKSHYENPTVMEFIDLESFSECYSSSSGRPNTMWNDLTVSHTAQNNLNSSNNSDMYYSYFYDLKQWCADTASNRQVKIKDQKGNERILSTFVDLEDDDFDPVEIYAYYLGLYVNNMRNGIFIDYLMSFPVTYEKKVRDRILKSFEKGIKKSLPEEILNNEEIMSKFRIKQGASEPSCYAVCALQQFNIEPYDDEKIFYSIFDFGGGTTDFDFGIWRIANEEVPEEEDYDFVIEHFGAGGDSFLGGENLLELLSYEVFKKNADSLLSTQDAEGKNATVGFTFCKPAECEIFDGYESLISVSQEAKRNTKSLMEELRPFMEGLQIKEDKISPPDNFAKEGFISVNLFDKDGNLKTSVPLKADADELLLILENRIEKGVKNFFHALMNNYEHTEDQNIKSVYIFLAGNSSKSPIVKELFDRYMIEYAEIICSKYHLEEEKFFRLFAPLGTPEADEQQKENGVEPDISSLTRPTGKTGVAYGLLDGRNGSNILVKNEISPDGEIPFKYYVGTNRQKKFKTILPKGIEYNKWVRLKNAMTTDFYLYYSDLPIVENNTTDIDNIKKKKCILPETFSKEFSIYIRAVKPNEIEYAVSTEEDISKNEYLVEPQSVELVI